MNLRPAQETAECWSLAKFNSPRDEEWVGRVHTQLLDRSPQPFDSCATLQILLPMIIAYKTYTAPNRRQPRIRVVDPQIKPELRTRSKHPIRLIRAFRHEIIDHDSYIRIGAIENHRLFFTDLDS